MVSQDVIIDETVKNNISYAKSNASHEEIVKALNMLPQMNLLKIAQWLRYIDR